MCDDLSISVIIPTMGRSSLYRAIDSATSQIVRPEELIVVADLLKEEEFKRVSDEIMALNIDMPVILRRTMGKGVAAARNLGVEVARGEYIAFLDDDDVWLPQHLSEFVVTENLQQYSGYFSGYQLASSGRVIGAQSQEITFGRLATKITRLGTSTAIIRKTTLVRYPFPELTRRSDIALWLILAKKFKLVFNPETTCIYDDSTQASLSKGALNKLWSFLIAVSVALVK